MSYQVLARKWRPRDFTEMVGQDHVLRALINALDNDRLHHAFLFTGTRGVGKTTIARILAKSLNCERGVSSRPCGQCDACREIDEGRFVDLIEVDAASRTKVEDTRELLENVQYAPTRGRYKVYLIDEVHMLSKHSFNALLKTLEEPPPHIKFLLATTDPQRLPITILSRCLQFNLKRLPQTQIGGHLSHILGQEGIEAEEAAVALIARAADGSMRDALSLLDQAIAYGGGKLRTEEVQAMLGSIDQEFIAELLEALAAGEGAALLATVERVAERGLDFGELLDDLISMLHRIAVAQVVPEAVEEDTVAALAERMAPEEVQLYHQIAIMGRRDLPYAPDERGALEMILLRMLAFRPQGLPSAAGAGAGKSDAAAPQDKPVRPAPVQDHRPRPASPARGAQAWPDILAQLNLGGMTREMAGHCVLVSRDENRIRLVLDAAHAHLLSPQRQQRLEQALRARLGEGLRLEIETAAPAEETPAARRERERRERQQAAAEAIERDSGVKVLQEVFDARIVPETVHPIE